MNQPKQGLVNAHADWMTRGLDTVTGEARMSEEINAIRESLDSVAHEDRKRMPERIFVGLWLPFFYEGRNQFYPQLSLAMWSSFAGNEYREVDVINPKGEVLFTVPPRFDRAGIRSLLKERARIPGGNILNVIRNAELKSRVSPRDGSMYLQSHLKQRAMLMGNIPPSVKTNIDRWNAIFKRYGLNPLTESEEVTHEPNALSTPSTNQVTSNDDWELL